MVEQDLMNALDEEQEKCIKKLRNAVYGYEVRTFITEYEELMLKKSDVVVKDFLKKREEGRRKTEVEDRPLFGVPKTEKKLQETISAAKNQSRQALHLSITALVISVVILIIKIILLL